MHGDGARSRGTIARATNLVNGYRLGMRWTRGQPRRHTARTRPRTARRDTGGRLGSGGEGGWSAWRQERAKRKRTLEGNDHDERNRDRGGRRQQGPRALDEYPVEAGEAGQERGDRDEHDRDAGQHAAVPAYHGVILDRLQAAG
jgi:hypothetical protein